MNLPRNGWLKGITLTGLLALVGATGTGLVKLDARYAKQSYVQGIKEDVQELKILSLQLYRRTLTKEEFEIRFQTQGRPTTEFEQNRLRQLTEEVADIDRQLRMMNRAKNASP